MLLRIAKVNNNKFENEPRKACENTWPWKLVCFPCCSFGLSGTENRKLGVATTAMELSIAAETAVSAMSWNQRQPCHTTRKPQRRGININHSIHTQRKPQFLQRPMSDVSAPHPHAPRRARAGAAVEHDLVPMTHLVALYLSQEEQNMAPVYTPGAYGARVHTRRHGCKKSANWRP